MDIKQSDKTYKNSKEIKMSTVRSIRRGKLITTRQAAAYMGVGESAIRSLLRGGEGDALPYIKLPGYGNPLFTEELLDQYINSHISVNDYARPDKEY